MKISDLTNKSFLGTNGAVENSYIMINYAETANGTPTTYKATVEELGKAIVKKLKLVDYDGSTQKVQNNSYVNDYTNVLVIGASSNGPYSDIIMQRGGMVPNVLEHKEGSYGYYSTASSDSWNNLPIGNITHGSPSRTYAPLFYNGSTAKVATPNDVLGTPLFYTYSIAENKNLFCDANGEAVDMGIGGGGSAAPYEIALSDDVFHYLLYNTSSGILSYSSDGDSPVSISLYQMEMSGDTYSYMGLSDYAAAIPNSVGDPIELGRPIFYDENVQKIGYYTVNGSFTEITPNELETGE